MTNGNKDLVSSGTKHESADGTINTIVLKTEQVVQGISETEELISLIDQVAVWVKTARADGKWDLSDLFAAVSLPAAFHDGFSGIQKIPGEYIHANGEERDKLYQDLIAAVRSVILAIKG